MNQLASSRNDNFEYDPVLYNADLAPVPASRRDWNWFNMATVWMGMVHNVVAYEAAAGLMAIGFSALQCLYIIGSAYFALCVAMWFNARSGTRYGLPFCVLIRSSFGPRGAMIPIGLRAICAIFWFSVQAYAASQALNAIISALWPGWAHFEYAIGGQSIQMWLAMCMIWVLHGVISTHGVHRIRNFELYAGPLVMIVAGIAAGWAIYVCHGVGPLFDQPSHLQGTAFWLKFGAAVTSIIGIWASYAVNIPDLSRFVRSQRDQVIGQAIGLPLTAILFTPMSIFITSATIVQFGYPIWNPVDILVKIDNTLLTLVGGATIIIAALSVNVAGNIMPAAYDLLSMFPRQFDFNRGSKMVLFLGIGVVPWLWFDHPENIYTVLNIIAGTLAPITGIMLADYYFIRHQKLHVNWLYVFSGPYYGCHGWRMSAISSMLLTLFFLYFSQIFHIFSFINSMSWFIGVFLSGLIYSILNYKKNNMNKVFMKR
ncbi:NCS1 family nucleobase:cation symporter-1 [Komagataeibacter swingsii]|uniref:Nitrate reductase n=1 Tax=Komagataeibacter swingsii TaxID=215220 RepID=A0A2V4QUQ6_9PROT|nr:NCS1 family nucleobase:cation symporter-1 [Komagataeibacter swingsii]PYD68251.1 nitrate reductase [Komagataeibacter swingsii]GBQ59952.1 cytosine/uracil/thiamine/allantoin permease [Komagataeibacter swingsii DSM 16373]